MNKTPAYTIRTVTNGEAVFNGILLNGGCIPVNYDRVPITPELFGPIEFVDAPGRKKMIEDFITDDLPAIFPRRFQWNDAFDHEEIDRFMDRPLGAIILLTSRCRSSLRCPMEKEFWREWVAAGNKRSEETSILKKDIRERYPKDYDLSMTGAEIVLPRDKGGARDQRDKREYLIAIADGGSMEWILERSDGRPNAYRIDCRGNQVTLIDPRAEIALED